MSKAIFITGASTGLGRAAVKQIAEVIFGAATDGSDRLRYVAGEEAKAMHKRRLEVGDHACMEGVREDFLGA